MARKIHRVKPVSIDKGNMHLDLKTDRLNRNLNDAQFALDSAVMTSMKPLMPMDTGQFINTTEAMSKALYGTGKVVAAAPPYGRYLYEGYVMVDSKTGKGPMKIPDGMGGYKLRFSKGAKLTRSNRKLSYYRGRNPQVTDHWFEAAEKRDSDKWMNVVDKEMNKP